MKRARRLLTTLLALVFAAAALSWILYVPYRPDWLFRAVPARATYVGRHRDLARRWDRMYANPLILSLFMSVGVKPSVLKEWAEHPEIRPWFDRLAGSDVVLACLPPRTSHGDPTWVLASWLGGRSQRLRWQLMWQKPEAFARRAARHGHVYWRVMTRDIEPGMVLTVALVEGVLIGCLSDSEERMIEVLDAWDGLLPAMARRQRDPVFIPAHMAADVFDAVWMESAGLLASGRRSFPLGLAFGEISRTSLACRAYAVGVPAPHADGRGDLDSLAGLLGDAPVWATSFPLSWCMAGRDGKNRVWFDVLQSVAEKQKASAIFVTLLGKEYAGRMAGIRVPPLLAALPLADPDKADQQLREALDILNARLRLGVIPYVWERAGETNIIVFEGTGQNFYGALPAEEKPAYAVCGTWLLFALQADTLRLLLNRSANSGEACWRKAVTAPAPFWAWGDFALGNDVLRLAFSAYSFKLLLERTADSELRRRNLEEWRAWLDAFEPLQQCAVRAEPWNSGGLQLDIRMGRYCP